MVSFSANSKVEIYQKEAQDAMRNGQREKAVRLLKQAIQLEPTDYRSWLLMSHVIGSNEGQKRCLAQAEKLSPGNKEIELVRERLLIGKQEATAVVARNAKETEKKRDDRLISKKVVSRKSATKDGEVKRVGWPVYAGLATMLFVGIVIVALLFLFPKADEAAELVLLPTVMITVAPTMTATPTATTAVLPPKQIVARSQRGRWTPSPTPTATNTPFPTITPTPTYYPTFVSGEYEGRPLVIGASQRWVDVNLTTQTMIAYEGLKAVHTTKVSSGTWEFPTVTGQFRVWLRYKSQTMDGRLLGYDYYIPNVPYVMYFFEDYALHGAYWHNNFGQQTSHGCVNLHPDDAEWLYYWSDYGTLVNVHY